MSLPIKFGSGQPEPVGLTTVLEGAAETVAVTLTRAQDSRARTIQAHLDGRVAVRRESPAIAALATVVDAINSGQPLNDKAQEIASLIHAQEQRATLVDQLLLTNDYQRVLDFTRARSHLEGELLQAVFANKLTVAEKLAVLPMIVSSENEARKRIKGGSFAVSDVVALLEKVDYASQVGDDDLLKKFAASSAQGREIVRKVVTRIGKAAHAAAASAGD